jgi:pyridoxal phosphate enzyme (YggS family)
MADARESELAASLAHMRDRIASACTQAGRDPDDVHLIVVTKTWPVEDVRRLADLGVRDVGENRDQDARAKAAQTADLDLTWHFIGQVQSNKANSVTRYADVVHSVDRPELVAALERGAGRAGRTVTCLIQVDLEAGPEGSTGRGGAPPSQVADLARAIEESPHLRLGGVMGVAPLDRTDQRSASKAAFAHLAHIHEGLLAQYPGAAIMSAGMSGDLAEAVAAGATHLRVGSAILGERPPLG